MSFLKKLIWLELVSRRDEFHVELVFARDEAKYLICFKTVIFCKIVVKIRLWCVFPPHSHSEGERLTQKQRRNKQTDHEHGDGER